jgi:hypothetical protein
VLYGVLETANAQECVIRDSGCLYGVEGSCVPRRTTYGYYETHWRNWPFGQQPRIAVKRQKRSSVPSGSTALPDAEVPRPKDEASISPELPHKQEELAPYVPSASPHQIDIDRQTDPFEDDLRTPAAEVPGNEGTINPFEDDLRTPTAEVPWDEGQADPIENGLQTPAVETPADDSGAIRLGPHGISPISLAPNSARGRNIKRRGPQYGRYNPLRGSFEKVKPESITTHRPQAAQAVAFEELTPHSRAKQAFASPQVDSRNSAAVSNPLRR